MEQNELTSRDRERERVILKERRPSRTFYRADSTIRNRLCFRLLLHGLDVGCEGFVDEWQDTSSCDRGAHKGIQLLVSTDGEL
jgi:hypothetical protein